MTEKATPRLLRYARNDMKKPPAYGGPSLVIARSEATRQSAPAEAHPQITSLRSQ